MSEAVLDYFLYNKNVFKSADFDKMFVDINPSLYEVVRIIDGVPLFLNEHCERLLNSAKILGYQLPLSPGEVEENIKKLARLNKIFDYNMKLIFNDLSSSHTNEYYFFIKSIYPTEEMYRMGVRTTLYNAIRENPNAKVINSNLRKEADRVLKAKNCYEALLVNSKDEITEGSRSNVFFIRDNTVFTAPKEDVLSGITRQRIISLCRRNDIRVVETPILSSDISSFSSAFISGTSPKVLPVSTVDEFSFKLDNALLLKVMKLYDLEIQEYLKMHSC